MAKGLSKEELLRIIMETASPAAASFGLEIWGVELIGSGRPVARVFVDVPLSEIPAGNVAFPPAEAIRPDSSAEEGAGLTDLGVSLGVSVDQCAEISRMVGLALDVEEIFPEAWVLEVSSPGLERPFFRVEQMAPYIGREVDIMLWEPHPDIPLRRKFRGELLTTDADSFSLKIEADAAMPRELTFPWNSARRARLVHIFPDTSKPGQGKAPRSSRNAGAAAGKGGGKNA